jgi:hypothetical protein
MADSLDNLTDAINTLSSLVERLITIASTPVDGDSEALKLQIQALTDHIASQDARLSGILVQVQSAIDRINAAFP